MILLRMEINAVESSAQPHPFAVNIDTRTMLVGVGGCFAAMNSPTRRDVTCLLLSDNLQATLGLHDLQTHSRGYRVAIMFLGVLMQVLPQRGSDLLGVWFVFVSRLTESFQGTVNQVAELVGGQFT